MKKRNQKVPWSKGLALLLAALMTAAAVGCGSTSGSSADATAQNGASTDAAAQNETSADAAATDDTATDAAAQNETAQADTASAETASDASASGDAIPLLPSTAGKDTHFTFIPAGPPAQDCPYTEWNDSPGVRYWLTESGAAPRDITIEFHTGGLTSASDYYATMLATGEYTDVMAGQLIPSDAAALYQEGVIVDIEDYVDAWMPNYRAFIDAHPELHGMIYNKIDGEEVMLKLYAVNETTGDPWDSLVYRRDWILKYGKNPKTGEAFTGGWNEDGTEWTDDIVFPSGNTTPIYISDWDWMLDIFKTAVEEQNLTDGYAMQMMYTGYYSMGDFFTGFGGSAPGWYETKDGEVRYGWTDDEACARAYVECLADWYKKGYIDPSFDERSGDNIFFQIDRANVFGGKIGAWLGLTSRLGNNLDMHDGGPTEGICFAAASSPINDVYGPKEAQGKEPWVFFNPSGILGSYVYFTNKIVDKDVEALCKAIDWLYAGEGAELSSFGLSDVQQEKMQDPYMIEMGLANGGYTKDGDTYVIDPVAVAHDYKSEINFAYLAIGMTIQKNVDRGRTDFIQSQFDETHRYEASVGVDYLKNQFTGDEVDQANLVQAQVTTYIDTMIPAFITGSQELNDTSWADFVNTVRSYGVDDITAIYRQYQ